MEKYNKSAGRVRSPHPVIEINMPKIDEKWLIRTETKTRSWAKSLLWRIAGFVILGSITYLWTGNWTESLGISSIFNIIRFVLYYFYERAWLKVRWGIIPEPFRK